MFFILFAGVLYAQKPASVFASDNFVLKGEMVLYLKNGEVKNGEYKIRGKDIKDSDISYQDIDSIVYNGGVYQYVNVKTGEEYPVKTLLLEVDNMNNTGGYLKNKKIAFYKGRLREKVNFPYDPRNTVVENSYMIKEGMDVAVKFEENEKFIEKYFSDCPALIKLTQTSMKVNVITPPNVFRIYKWCQ